MLELGLVLARVQLVDLTLHGGLLLGELLNLQAVRFHRGGQRGDLGRKFLVDRDVRRIGVVEARLVAQLRLERLHLGLQAGQLLGEAVVRVGQLVVLLRGGGVFLGQFEDLRLCHLQRVLHLGFERLGRGGVVGE